MAELSNLTTLDDVQLLAINGGLEPDKIASGLGAIASATSIAVHLGGASIFSMSVGSLLACGPVGWAIAGAVVVGSFVGGYLIGDGLR
ncbi:MAG TPA: hypothetical protein PK828_08940 [Limnochordia bacterium]|nr:hypothetical protein [Limnochordia bacterium]HXK97972.1 hypothetical protein [Limnochordia bacterium]